MSVFAPILLSAATTAMVALPLAPALRELRNRKDAAPLPTRTDDAEIRSFARSFRRYIAPTMSRLDAVAASGITLEESMSDGAPALLLGGRGACEFQHQPVDSVVLCANDAFLPSGATFIRDMYVRGRLMCGTDDVLRAALVESDAHLGDRNVVLRWIHANRDLFAGESCQLYGRASADGIIYLARGCRFERIGATAVVAGMNDIPAHLNRPAAYNGRSIIDCRFGRMRSYGGIHLATGDIVQGHIVSVGRVQLDESVRVVGSVKSHSDVIVSAGVEVAGAVTSKGRLEIGDRAYLRGPVLCESDVAIGPGVQIGSPDCPTTVSAPRITMASGSVVYGTLWARESGEVLP